MPPDRCCRAVSCYQGPQVSRRIQALQEAADREGEAQRALMQDYAAEFDRQTGLYHRRREELIAARNGDRRDVQRLVADTVRRVASRLAAVYLGEDVDGDYASRFRRLREDMLREYGVDCEELHGAGLHLLPVEIASLITLHLDRQAAERGEVVFAELARLLYLRVCSDLWPGHIAALRDSVATELLGTHSHKTAVASHVRRCNDELTSFWQTVAEEFLSRLCTMPPAADRQLPHSPVVVSGETQSLLSRYDANPDGDGVFNAENAGETESTQRIGFPL